ncbi:MAG: TrkA family potassium uptake protein [Lachnospiraceae bacterium]|nr:TrkA family potassium uptake protein [Lachnospiraceae bacterium]
MKSVLIIGMGRFGHHLCTKMVELGNEVMIVDENEEKIKDMLPMVLNAQIGDCTDPNVLKELGVRNFDICFVCIGTNFQSSLEISSLLKEMGARYVISKANRDIQAKFLLRNGADEVLYPDRDVAQRAAIRFSANHVFDYVGLTSEYSMYEIPPMEEWVGKSIREVNFRAKYQVTILGIKKEDQTDLIPDADHIFEKNEHLMIVGRKEDVDRILEHIE